MKIPIPEYRFCPERKWRFDYAYVEQKIAIEQEGGIWNNGAHVRGKHFLSDMQKYNMAAKMGWRVLRYTPDQMYVEAINDLKVLGLHNSNLS